MAKHKKPFILMALKTGAHHIGNGVLNAVEDVNQPSDVVLSNVLAALKSGALNAGKEIARERLGKLI